MPERLQITKKEINMQSLKENVHIEDKYAGVTLGAINLPRGMIYIDAPLIPEDARSWRADQRWVR